MSVFLAKFIATKTDREITFVSSTNKRANEECN